MSYTVAKVIIIAVIVIIVLLLFFSSLPTYPSPNLVLKCSNSNAESNNTSNSNSRYFIDLTTGNTQIYERKALIIFPIPWREEKVLGWGDDVVPIIGKIEPSNPNDQVSNKIINVNANSSDGKLLFERLVKTNDCGEFGTTFFTPNSETIIVTAKLIDGNSIKSSSSISVVVTESLMPVIIIALLIISAVTTVVIISSQHWLESIFKKPSGSNKSMLYTQDRAGSWSLKYVELKRLGLIPVLVFTILAYVTLYKFAPFDSAGNAAIALALIAPIAAYIFKVLEK
jgi:hypothetical protein